MNRNKLKKLFVGPFGAVPTPFDKKYEIDLGALNAMIQRMIDGGVSNENGVIKIAAGLGEGPMLDESEWAALLGTAVQATQGKAPVLLGIHHKDTKRTIADAKRASDLGAIGLQISPPVFNSPTQQDIYEYYYEVSNKIDLGIMIYNTRWMTWGKIDSDTIVKMSDIENIIAVKWPGDPNYDDMLKFKDSFNVIDNSTNPVRCFKNGGHGYVQTILDSNPKHDMKVWGLLKAGKFDEAEVLYHSVYDDIVEMETKVSQRTGGQSTVHKGLSKILGYPIGDPRPPSDPMSENEMDELRKSVKSWGWTVVN